jgi:hypothetical protein
LQGYCPAFLQNERQDFVSESKPLKKAADAWKAAEKEKADSTGTSGGNRGRDSGNTRDDLYKRFGLKDGVPLSVFIQIHPGKKNPVNAGWQKITLEDTLTSPYQSMLETAAVWGNVGVLLGPPSNGLCAIDCDINDPGRAEKENELLLDLSPKLKQTIAVRRLSPHCQTFVRILGDYPKGIFGIKHRDGTRINVRVPHRGEVQVPTGYLNWMLSSNSVQTGRELANRSIITRISKQKAGYKFREYEEGDVLAHIKANRVQVLGAIFAVIIEWDRQGRPRTGESRHEFRAWAGALDWIVQNLFGGAPLIDGHLEEVSRVSDPALSWLRLIAIAVEGSRRLGWNLMRPES